MGSLTPTIPIFNAGQNTCVPWMSLLPLGDCSIMGLPKLSQVGGVGGGMYCSFLVKDFSTKITIT